MSLKRENAPVGGYQGAQLRTTSTTLTPKFTAWARRFRRRLTSAVSVSGGSVCRRRIIAAE